MTKVKVAATLAWVLGIPGMLSAQAGNSHKATESIKPKVECSAMAGRIIPASAIALPTKGAT